MCFLSWASHTFLITTATVRHPSMGIMPGFGVWNSASCPWLTVGSRGWYLVTLNLEVWENKRPKKKGLSSGSELRFVELSGLSLNEHRFKSWLCHLLVVRSKHRSDRQHTRTLLGEVLAWVKSAFGASLTVSRGEERQRFAWKCPCCAVWGMLGHPSGLSEELLLSRNEPALVSLFNPDTDGVWWISNSQEHSQVTTPLNLSQDSCYDWMR